MATQCFLLGVAITLSMQGVDLYQKPFLLHCLDQSSTLLNTTNGVTFCDLDDLDDTWPNCISDPTKHKNLSDFAEALHELEKVSIKFNSRIKAVDPTRFQNLEIQNLEKIKRTRLEVEKELSVLGVNRLVQKVRICSQNEEVFRITALVILIILVTLAVLAIVRLHKISFYEVSPIFHPSKIY